MMNARPGIRKEVCGYSNGNLSAAGLVILLLWCVIAA